MHQSSTNGVYNLLSLASQILAKTKEQARARNVATDIKEIWNILRAFGLRPNAIGSTAAELRQLLITGHLAEARRICLNPPPETAGSGERNRAFKMMCDNIIAVIRMPAPPAPSLTAPPVSNDVTAAVVLVNDPFVSLPKGCVQFTGAIPVDQFLDDGDEPMEVEECDIYEDEEARIPTMQPVMTARDQAAIERFFGGAEEARKFGFGGALKTELASEDLLTELESESPPRSDEIVPSGTVDEGSAPLSGPRMVSEAVGGYAS